jgi:hypothetical protein
MATQKHYLRLLFQDTKTRNPFKRIQTAVKRVEYFRALEKKYKIWTLIDLQNMIAYACAPEEYVMDVTPWTAEETRSIDEKELVQVVKFCRDACAPLMDVHDPGNEDEFFLDWFRELEFRLATVREVGGVNAMLRFGENDYEQYRAAKDRTCATSLCEEHYQFLLFRTMDKHKWYVSTLLPFLHITLSTKDADGNDAEFHGDAELLTTAVVDAHNVLRSYLDLPLWYLEWGRGECAPAEAITVLRFVFMHIYSIREKLGCNRGRATKNVRWHMLGLQRSLCTLRNRGFSSRQFMYHLMILPDMIPCDANETRLCANPEELRNKRRLFYEEINRAHEVP